MTAAAAPRPFPVDRTTAARSALWSLLENGGLALISFASLIVYSRFLSVSDFGLFSIVLATVELLTVPVSMLFHDALVQRPEVGERHYDTAFSVSMVLGLVMFGLCAAAAPAFARHTGHADAAPVLLWTALSLPLTAAGASIVARQRRQREFRALAIRSLAGRGAGAVIGIALVVAGAGFWGLVAQHVLVAGCGTAVLWWRSPQRPRLRIGTAELRQLLRFGSIAVGVLFLNLSIKRSFVILSGIALGTHAAGLLNLAFRTVDTFWSLASTAIAQIALPILSTLRDDKERFARAYRSASSFACVTLYFGFFLIGALSPELVELLFGPAWLAVAPYVTVLSLQVLVQARRLLLSPVLTALGRPRDLLASQAGELVFVLAAIALSGVPSLAWAVGIWVVREVLGGSIQGLMFRRATGIGFTEQARASLVPLLCALAMAGAVMACRSLLPDTPLAGLPPAARLGALGVIGSVVFAGFAMLLQRKLVFDLVDFGRAALRRRAGAAA